MALKPDITISVIKNTDPCEKIRKLFYNENVFRLDPRQKEFCEVNQIGLEFIGAGRGYPEAEVVSLAARSLACIDEEYVLNIGHMGLTLGFFEYAGVADTAVALDLISQKNRHGLLQYAQSRGMDEKTADLLCGMAGKGFDFSNTAPLNAYAVNESAAAVCRELEELSAALVKSRRTENIRFDFSAVNDTDYYNGIVLKGYVKKSGSAVLGGGRYDNLMKRFGKPQQAAGFALYLSELERAYYTASGAVVESLLIYGDSGADAVLKAADLLAQKGSVLCVKDGAGITAREVYVLNKDGNPVRTEIKETER